MKILSVVGARPNFIKIAPLARAISAHNTVAPSAEQLEHVLLHTGQHYDDAMSTVFFETLGIPKPDINLGIGSGTHAEQVGRTMIAFEKALAQETPDWVILVGDVNAVCACSIVARKMGIRSAHIEAGLRSRDMTMPEEVNRLVADRICDLLLPPDEFSVANLAQEGVAMSSVEMVGNIMIDTLEFERDAAAGLSVSDIIGRNWTGPYGILTMHRPSNVDNPQVLRQLVELICTELATQLPIIWPLHPRTKARLEETGLMNQIESVETICTPPPLGYRELLRLNMGATVMLSDSGGLQEECCILGTPCITMRTTTERPVTLQENGGTCTLTGPDPHSIRAAFANAIKTGRQPSRPPLWDGHTAERIVASLLAASTL